MSTARATFTERWRQLPDVVQRLALPALVLLLAILYPWYFGGLPGAFPAVETAVIMLIFTVMALGLNVVVGYAGLLDLGYVAFYAAGAYVAAWLASVQFEQVTFHLGSIGIVDTLPGIHISIWIVLVAAALFTTIVGVLIGLPTLRLRGDYLAIVTLGFGEIVPQVVRNGDDFGGFDLTHGTFGISPIDSIGFGNTLNDTLGLPASYQTSTNRAELFYLTALALLLFTVFCSVRLRDSRLGRAWIAIREDETAAAAMGVPLMRTKTWSYATGAFFGGLAGAFYAVFKSGAFPSDFFFNFSIFILCMVILGGMGSVWGVIVGGLVLSYLDREGLAKVGSFASDVLNRPIDVPKYAFGVYGAIIVAMMLFRPAGMIPEKRHRLEIDEGVESAAVASAEQGGDGRRGDG
ncbi:MAG: branched-chain amino acid ABC transporter permease [Actinobacteria bacterium]|nr:branched-chain amino acid ABC transporter permease [Actinomycetota bacterium]